MNNSHISSRRFRQTRRAFTVLEVMVALGILAILLVIIILPLRVAFDSLNKSSSQSLTQSSLDSTIAQFDKDLRQAVYVFPNARVPGVTDKEPYTTANNPNGLPYYISTDKRGRQTNRAKARRWKARRPRLSGGLLQPWSNTSRIDMIQVRRDDSGNVLTPIVPSYNIVTYYARRQQLDKAL